MTKTQQTTRDAAIAARAEIYRGYYIYPGLIGDWFVKRDGFVLHCAKSLALARAAVDEIVGTGATLACLVQS